MLIGVFGESTMSRTQFQLCYNRFKEGREDVNDDASHEHVNNPWKHWNSEGNDFE